MTEAARRLRSRSGTAWGDALVIIALAAAIAGLRAVGYLPPDTALPVTPWILEAAATAVTGAGR
jgi:hypothetical protein